MFERSHRDLFCNKFDRTLKWLKLAGQDDSNHTTENANRRRVYTDHVDRPAVPPGVGEPTRATHCLTR